MWEGSNDTFIYRYVGTGKTLVARALANECSKGDKRVAFFMRKGADCLSKWVGESERQLRLLFDQVSNSWFFYRIILVLISHKQNIKFRIFIAKILQI